MDRGKALGHAYWLKRGRVGWLDAEGKRVRRRAQEGEDRILEAQKQLEQGELEDNRKKSKGVELGP